APHRSSEQGQDRSGRSRRLRLGPLERGGAGRRRRLMGFSFLTPLNALFAVRAGIALAPLWLPQAHVERVGSLFSLLPTRRRELVGVVVALAVLPMLVGVAAAQPVVVRHHVHGERSDAQVFLVFDTSRSMSARQNLDAPTRLERSIQD